MGDEVERLRALLDACHRVLPGVEGHDDDLADAIRKTCLAVEARLSRLGVAFESPFAPG